MERTNPSSWEKICLLTWKNFMVLWYRRSDMITHFVVPSIFLVILVILRIRISVEHVDAVVYTPVDLMEQWKWVMDRVSSDQEKLNKHGIFLHNCFLPKLIVAFAPNTTSYKKLMEYASQKYLNNIELMEYESGWEVRFNMQTQYFLAGVIFNHSEYVTNDAIMTSETFTDVNNNKSYDLDYSLVFPSEIRFYGDSFVSLDWTTGVNFEAYHNYDYIDYLKEGFLSLQNAIGMSFIRFITKSEDILPAKINRFANAEKINDPLMQELTFSLSLIILVAYLGPCIQYTRNIAKERSANLKPILRVYGITRSIHAITWYFRGLVLSIIGSALLILFLKIKWYDGFGICTYSSWTAVFLVILCYNVACTSFCYMIASFASGPSAGMVIIGVTWVLTFMPYLASQSRLALSIANKIAICMFSNSLMGISLHEIIEFEIERRGLQWKTIFEKAGASSFIAVGWACVILIAFSLIYSIVGLFMEDILRFGSIFFSSWLKIFHTWAPQKEQMRKSSSAHETRKAKISQIDNATREITIEIKDLSKVYGEESVIHDVSLVFYQDEITVIMGHNGSGKTTLLSMIAGISRPTKGQVLYENLDIYKYPYNGYNIGICVKNNLYLNLTTRTLVVFYCRLKGMESSEVSDEVDRYLREFNLAHKSKVLVGDLEEDQKKNLSICCALCGKSNYVIIDEPSKEMDILDRRKLWSFLMREKSNRTIIVSTQSTEEAEVLSDRLAILSNGELMCYGSPYFLKAIYSKGFRLICIKKPNCNTEEVSEFLRKYIKNIYPECEIGQQLTYRLKERYSFVFGKMLADLEEAFEELKICGLKIREPIIEDIFLSMGAENPSKDNYNRYVEIMNGLSVHVEEYNKLSFVEKHKVDRGLTLFLKHIRSIIFKRYTFIKRRNVGCLQLILPAFVTFLTYLMRDEAIMREVLIPKTFRISHYPETVSVLTDHLIESSTNPQEEPHSLSYFSDLYTEGIGHTFISTGESTMDDFILMTQRKDEEFNLKYLIGASKEEGTMIAWYNMHVPHTAPLSLNMVHNGLLLLSGYKGRISVSLDPLPFEVRGNEPLMVYAPNILFNYHFHYSLAINLSFTLCFTNTFLVIYLIDENSTRFKLLQYIGGIRHLTFYLGSLIFDIGKFIVIAFTVFLIIILYENDNHTAAAGYCFLVLILFGLSVMPLYYAFGLLFRDYLLGYVLLTMFTIYGVSSFSILGSVHILSSESLFILKWISYLIPHFALCEAITKILKCATRRDVCLTEEHQIISMYLDGCKTQPNCCKTPKEMSWDDDGILNEIIYFLVYGGICTIILFIYEFRSSLHKRLGFTVPKSNIILAKEEYEISHMTSELDTQEFVQEKLRIQNLLQREYQNKPLVAINMGKIIGKKIAVHHFSIVCNKSEFVGILGANNSGKTTLISMLVGRENPTCGRAYVNGISLTDELYHMYEHIGYCPDNNALPMYMTCKEILEFFCHLRGVPTKYIADMSLCLAKVLGFDAHYNKNVGILTAGIRRRISTAVSLVGSPAIIYLDESTTGVDAAGKLQIFNIIGRLCKLGKTIIMTTQHAHDCERFCSRLGFLYKGRILCINSVQHIQNRFVNNYLLHVKVKVILRPPSFMEYESLSMIQIAQNPLWSPFRKVITFMEEEFPKSSIYDHRGAIITFMIPAETTSMSEIFKKLNRNTFILNIEAFSISHESLAVILTEIAEKNQYVSSVRLS